MENQPILRYTIDMVNQYWDDSNYRVFCIQQDKDGSFCYLSSNEANNRIYNHLIRLSVDIREFTPTAIVNTICRNYRKWISQQGIFSYIAVLPDGNSWETTIEAKDKLLYGIGRKLERGMHKGVKLNGMIKEINHYTIEENFFFCATIYKKDNSFFLESLDCSQDIQDMTAALINQEVEILFKDATYVSNSKLIEKSLIENKIVSYYETINATNFQITLIPLVSVNKVIMKALAIDQSVSRDSTQIVPKKSLFHPTCTIIKNAVGNYELADSNLLFEKFTKNKLISLEEITTSTIFKERYETLSCTFGVLKLEQTRARGKVFLECIPTIFQTTQVGTLCHFTCEEDMEKLDMFRGMLSKRESEVLSFVVEGYSNQGIAKTLSISIGTVKKLIYNCYKKLGVSSRFELVDFIYSN